PVHEGMARRTAAMAVLVGAHRFQQTLLVDRFALFRYRRKVDHAQDRPVRGRRHTDGARGAVLPEIDARRRFVGDPEQAGDEARALADPDMGTDAVALDDRLAAVVVAGDDPAYLMRGMHGHSCDHSTDAPEALIAGPQRAYSPRTNSAIASG